MIVDAELEFVSKGLELKLKEFFEIVFCENCPMILFPEYRTTAVCTDETDGFAIANAVFESGRKVSLVYSRLSYQYSVIFYGNGKVYEKVLPEVEKVDDISDAMLFHYYAALYINTSFCLNDCEECD